MRPPRGIHLPRCKPPPPPPPLSVREPWWEATTSIPTCVRRGAGLGRGAGQRGQKRARGGARSRGGARRWGGAGLPLARAGRVSAAEVPCSAAEVPRSAALLPQLAAKLPERVCAAPLPLGSRWREAPLCGAASGPFSCACGAGCGVTAMASGFWRRRTLERCLGEVGKATGRPECFLT